MHEIFSYCFKIFSQAQCILRVVKRGVGLGPFVICNFMHTKVQACLTLIWFSILACICRHRVANFMIQLNQPHLPCNFPCICNKKNYGYQIIKFLFSRYRISKKLRANFFGLDFHLETGTSPF